MKHVKEKLARLREFLELGVVTQEEFDEERRRLVDEAMGRTPTPASPLSLGGATVAGTAATQMPGATPVGRAASPLAGATHIGTSTTLPERLGSYRVLGVVGQGGMGTVVRARHVEEGWAQRQGGDVAIKLVHPHLLAGDSTFRKRFLDEAQLGRRVQHSSLATVHDVIVEGLWLGMVMTFVEGPTLTERVRPGGRPLAEVLQILRPLGEALDHLHAQGVVHRDLKPANIKIRADDVPVILDLGIAKDLRSESSHTQTHATMGTTVWMAPEQLDAKHATGAADRYAFGLIAYALLAGRMPWPEDTSEARLIVAKMRGELKPLAGARTDLGRDVSEAVMAMLVVEPIQRPESCAELVQRLTSVKLSLPERIAEAIRAGRCVIVLEREVARAPEMLQAMKRRPDLPFAVLGDEPVGPAATISAGTMRPCLDKPDGLLVLVEPTFESRSIDAVGELIAKAQNRPHMCVVARAFNPFLLPKPMRLLKMEQERTKGLAFLRGLDGLHPRQERKTNCEPPSELPLVCRTGVKSFSALDENDIPAMVELLKSENESAQEKGARALAKLAEDTENKIPIKDAGGVILLVSLLSSRNEAVQEQAVNAIANLTHEPELQQSFHPVRDYMPEMPSEAAWERSEGMKSAIRDAGGIEALVGLLGLNSELVQEHASRSLGLLATNDDNREAIREAGGIEPLVSLLRSTNRAVLVQTIQALACCARDSDGKASIREVGGIALLVALLRSTKEAVQEQAAAAIKVLAGDSQNAVDIRKAGGIASLVALLGSSDVSVLSESARALEALAKRTPENRGAIRERGGLALLVTLLHSTIEEEVRFVAVEALGTLAQDPENRRAIRDAGGIEHLVANLKSTNCWVKWAVAGAIAETAFESVGNQLAVREAGGIPPLVDLVRGSKNSSGIQQKPAAEALRNLASNIKNQQAIREAGGIAPLVELLKSNDDAIVEHAAGALWKLSVTPEARTTIREAGGISSLVALLGSINKDVKRQAAGILANLAADPKGKMTIREAGGIDPLVGLLTSTEHGTRRQAVRAIANLSTERRNRKALHQAGGLALLIKILQSTNEQTLRHAARALEKLAVDYANIIREAEGIPAVVALLRSPNEALQELAASTLRNLSENRENRVAVREAGGVPPLVSLLNSGKETLQVRAAGSLWKLSVNSDNKVAIREAGGLIPLVALLGSTNVEVQVQAAGALRNLSVDADNKVAIREAGGLAPLVALLRSPSEDAQRQAAKALGNLSEDPGNRVAIRQAGGVSTLEALMQSGSEAVREHAAGALRAVLTDIE